MAVKNQVLVEFAPKITPTRIEVLDAETPDADFKRLGPESSGFKRQLGKKIPLIQISGFRVAESSILSFTISQNGFLPEIHFSFIDSTKAFTSDAFPTITPIASVYLASGNKMLKSISGDYLITNIRSITLPNGIKRYDYTGELYVPRLNSNKSIAYSNMTSVDAMRAIAKDLQLGFATNEDQTTDTMTWINPNLGYKTFIQNIVDRAYKNEKSFFQVFIDRNYILNFINVEKQYARDADVDVTYLGFNAGKEFDIERFENIESADDITEVPMVLTNTKGATSNDMKILDYSPISENGDILRLESFRKRAKWYRHNEQLLDFFVEPISDLAPGKGKAHQTPTLTDYVGEDVVKWVGTDYRNAHENYKFARVINMHNEKELYKNQLKVVLDGANFTVPRGSRVQVVIVNEVLEDMFASNSLGADQVDDPNKPNSPVNSETVDENLSDFYYVKDVIVKFRSSNQQGRTFVTEMILSKRNWIPTREKVYV